MGVDNVNDSTPVPPAEGTNEQLAVKISHGNEIRRVTLPQCSYASLVEHTVSLFGLPQANIILKYEDEDGDKISMSTDMELTEALRLAKASQKILRLYVELKALPAAEKAESPAPQHRDVYLGPQGGFGMPPQRPMHPPGFHHLHPHPHPHPHFAHTDPTLPYMPAFPFAGPATAYHVHQQTTAPSAPPQQPTTTTSSPSVAPTQQLPPGYGTPNTHGPPAPVYGTASAHATPTYSTQHGSSTYAAPYGSSSSMGHMDSERGWGRGGVHHGPDHRHQYRRAHYENSYFGPQTNYTTRHYSGGTWGDSCSTDRQAHRESMRVMREQWRDQWREMKAEMKKGGVATEEDKRRLKELKQEMKNDIKNAKMNMKGMKLTDKKQRLVARHVEDVTIPDGTELPPNTPFIKTWKIRNEGPAWPTGSQLLFVSHRGDNLNGPERVVIKGEVLPGQEVEVSVPLITPSEPGRYVGYYRMVTPDGVKFGQRVWVSFIVKSNEEINAANIANTTVNNTNNNYSNNASAELSKVCDTVG